MEIAKTATKEKRRNIEHLVIKNERKNGQIKKETKIHIFKAQSSHVNKFFLNLVLSLNDLWLGFEENGGFYCDSRQLDTSGQKNII